MKLEQSEKIIINNIKKIMESNDIPFENKEMKIYSEMPLIGGHAKIDSMALVELCVELEAVADEMGKSIFRTVKSLSKEFLLQSNKK